MKKLLLILFLIPNLIMAEESKWKRKPTFNVEAAKAAGLSDEEIQKLIAAGPPKQPTISQEKYDKKYRNYCAMQAGDAKSDFAAKKMYETCLDQYGVSK
jgi:hypothetical protein